jgi:hypothetical protein
MTMRARDGAASQMSWMTATQKNKYNEIEAAEDGPITPAEDGYLIIPEGRTPDPVVAWRPGPKGGVISKRSERLGGTKAMLCPDKRIAAIPAAS